MTGMHRALPPHWQKPSQVATVVLLVAVLCGGLASIVSPSLFRWTQDAARGEVIVDNPGKPGDLLGLSV